MGSQDVSPAVYRGLNIVLNPSGEPHALTDAFLILEPSINPMFASTLYEHPRADIKTYETKEAARDAAMNLAHAWIDARLHKAVE
jgi:hypothetical protein